MGLVAIVFGPILVGGGAFREGKQVVPPLPFVFGGWGLGFMMLGPYLALRNYVPEGDGEEAGPLEVLCVHLARVRRDRWTMHLLCRPRLV